MLVYEVDVNICIIIICEYVMKALLLSKHIVAQCDDYTE